MITASRSEGFDENTMFKVYDSLREAGLNEQDARDCINEMQKKGILFRESLPVSEDVVPWKHKPGYRIRDDSSTNTQRTILNCPYCGDAFSAPSFAVANEMLNRHIDKVHGTGS
jgi:hypothetical protein